MMEAKKTKFREIDDSSKEVAAQAEKENQMLNREISEIILRADGKNRCLFKPQDVIWNLSKETADMPSEEEKSEIAKKAKDYGMPLMCNTCCNDAKSIKKLKFCQFCG